MDQNKKWKFTQVFGDKFSADKVANEDIISALAFNKSGDFLTVGDRAGRLIFFQRNLHTKSKTPFNEFVYLTEIQSHYKEFDFLQSVDIEEKINCIEWVSAPSENMLVLSANDKTIKLWKIANKTIKKSEKFTSRSGITASNLRMPKLKTVEQNMFPSLKRTFPSLHSYHINSLCISPNSTNFLSSDDLSVLLWDLEEMKVAHDLVNIKPPSMTELTEVITSATFNQLNESQFAVGTSKGVLKLFDTRESARFLNNGILFSDENLKKNKNLFTDIVSSIAHLKFSADGSQLITRDYLTTKIWDQRKTKEPIKTIKLFEPFNSKLYEVYEQDIIFDKFNLGISPEGRSFVTGFYNNYFHICDIESGRNTQFELNFNKKTIMKNIPQNHFETLSNNFDLVKKVSKVVWNPVHDCVVLASLNCLFIYNAI